MALFFVAVQQQACSFSFSSLNPSSHLEVGNHQSVVTSHLLCLSSLDLIQMTPGCCKITTHTHTSTQTRPVPLARYSVVRAGHIRVTVVHQSRLLLPPFQLLLHNHFYFCHCTNWLLIKTPHQLPPAADWCCCVFTSCRSPPTRQRRGFPKMRLPLNLLS